MKKQQGFGAIGVILVVVAVALIGVIGWRAYDASKSKSNSQANNQTGSKSSDQNGSTTTQPADPYAGWKTYTSSVAGYSVKYPADWSLKTNNADYEHTVITSPDQFQIQLDSFTKDSKYGSSTFAANPSGACGSTCLATNPLSTFTALKYGTLMISADKQGAGGGSVNVLDLSTSSSSFYIASPVTTDVTTSVSGFFQGRNQQQNTAETMEQFTSSASVKIATQIYKSLAY